MVERLVEAFSEERINGEEATPNMNPLPVYLHLPCSYPHPPVEVSKSGVEGGSGQLFVSAKPVKPWLKMRQATLFFEPFTLPHCPPRQ
jgi:hypothetical protein